jgi:uncharacterized RDD family membrane protein YckC
MRLFKRKNPKPPVRRGPSGRVARDLVTPEGVALTIQLADIGERAGALMLDLFFMAVAMVAMTIGIIVFGGVIRSPFAAMVGAILLMFLLRSFYFTLFEIRWQGQTPGKRIMHLLVINRSGGRLTTDAILARNLMREVEIFLPLSLLGLAGAAGGSAGWTVLSAIVWVGILVLLPFFNRDKLRAGDLIAGTIVVHKPKALLVADLAGAEARGAEPRAAQPRYHFTQAQLDVYGIYELQTLESLLRRGKLGGSENLVVVAERIARKIKWTGNEFRTDSFNFLNDYYVALRSRLEGQMLMGRRRESKHDAA